MEQRKYLIDTNVVIDFLGKKIPNAGMILMNEIIDSVPNISIITKIEVLGFHAAEEHYSVLKNFINDSSLYPLSNTIVEQCIELRKKYKTKLPDAIIAATALVYNLALISRNVSDFKEIEKLEIINPYSIIQKNPASFRVTLTIRIRKANELKKIGTKHYDKITAGPSAK